MMFLTLQAAALAAKPFPAMPTGEDHYVATLEITGMPPRNGADGLRVVMGVAVDVTSGGLIGRDPVAWKSTFERFEIQMRRDGAWVAVDSASSFPPHLAHALDWFPRLIDSSWSTRLAADGAATVERAWPELEGPPGDVEKFQGFTSMLTDIIHFQFTNLPRDAQKPGGVTKNEVMVSATTRTPADWTWLPREKGHALLDGVWHGCTERARIRLSDGRPDWHFDCGDEQGEQFAYTLTWAD